ncbi:type IV secretion system protein [Xanthomonas bonasiae]|jgi:type IV secretion system protein VirB6|uniref:type IV secretion system protein n=1 Tax=Xanthomonas bonasiae TaxID=2810351 RepID=UPI0038781084
MFNTTTGFMDAALGGALSSFLGNMANYAFFSLINDYLRDEIDIFQWALLQRTTMWMGAIALTVLTLWILLQGYRIVTGQARDSAMAMVVTALRATLIIALATSMATGSSKLYWTLTDGLSKEITQVVTGDDDSPYDKIDQNLLLMQTALASIDALQAAGNKEQEDDKTRARWFMGLGIAGPGVVAGSMLLLNKIAMALFIGFGPLFIMCLLFNATKQLFSKWLYYGIGTVFSLSVLSVMVAITTKVVGAVALAFVTKWAANGWSLSGEGISSMSLQQGGLGLVMTTLVVTAPPMAAAFFQGVLGQFSPYSAMGAGGGAAAVPAGPGGSFVPRTPQAQNNNLSELNSGQQPQGQGARVAMNTSTPDSGSTGVMGAANRPRNQDLG